MKRQNKSKSGERGIALIIIVFLLLGLLYVATLKMVIVTGTELSNLNQEIALDYAEEFSMGLSSPIKHHISDYVQNELTQVLGQHLSNDNSAHQSARTYSCQGTIDPNAELSSQFAICDPVNFLKNLKGESDQTIDDIGMLRKHTDPKLYNTHQFQEIVRQTANGYSYTLYAAFVGQELLVPLRPPVNKTAPLPRVEQYRFLVRAEILSKTYYSIQTPFIMNFDIVINVNTFDSGFSGCAGSPSGGVRVPGFGGVSAANGALFCGPENGCVPVGIVTCQIDANGIINKDSCSAGLYGSSNYQKNCCNNGNCDGANDSCASATNGSACDVAGQGVQTCQVPSKPGSVTFFYGGFASAHEVTVGCAGGAIKTTSTGQRVNSGYTWNTVIRTVSMGKNYD